MKLVFMSHLTIAIDARLAGSANTGDTSHWSGLLWGLNQLDVDATFLLFLNNESPPKVSLDNRFKIVRIGARSSRYWSLVTFPLAARRMEAQVFHTQYNLSPLIRRGGVTTIHDVSFFAGPEWFQPKDRFLMQKFIPGAVRRAERVVVVSQTTADEIEKYIPGGGSKCRVVYNALTVGFEPVSRETAKERVRDELGINDPYMLTVGTRWPRKNMKLATSAFQLLSSRIPQRLVITGKPGWGEEEEMAGCIRTGYVDDSLMPSLYAAADLYLAPSLYEGFGIPLLEAWASDCPVLCSSGPPFPEVARDAAWVEPSWEAAHWARSIETLLGDSGKLEELRKNGHRRLADFDWKESARVLWSVYQDAAQL